MFLQLTSNVFLLALSVNVAALFSFPDEKKICTKICMKTVTCTRFTLHANLICQNIKGQEESKCILLCSQKDQSADDEKNHNIVTLTDESDYSNNFEDEERDFNLRINSAFPADQYGTDEIILRLLSDIAKLVKERNINRRRSAAIKKDGKLKRHVRSIIKSPKNLKMLIAKGRLREKLLQSKGFGNRIGRIGYGGSYEDANANQIGQQENGGGVMEGPPETISPETTYQNRNDYQQENGEGVMEGPPKTISYTIVPNSNDNQQDNGGGVMEGPPETISYTLVPNRYDNQQENGGGVMEGPPKGKVIRTKTITYDMISNRNKNQQENGGGVSVDQWV